MEEFEKIQIDALLAGGQETTSEDLELGRQVHTRAWRILENQTDRSRMQILSGSDDDRMVSAKEKRIVYESDGVSQHLLLTNFHKNHLDKSIAVEIPDERGHYSSTYPNFLFAVTPDGEINSPLGLVRPELAGAILELFEEAPKVDSVRAA